MSIHLRIGASLVLVGLLALPHVARPTEAAWIQLCEGGSSARPVAVEHREYLQIDGSRRWLELTDRPIPGCARQPLPVPVDQVLWFGLIPEAKAARLSRGVILQGSESDDQLRISEVVVSDPPKVGRTPLPLAVDLISHFNPRPYGVEERAGVVLTDESLQVNCAPGMHPAGVVLRNDGARLPEAIEATLVLSHRADSPFTMGYADGVRHSLDDPLPVGTLSAAAAGSTSPQSAQFPLPAFEGGRISDPEDRPTVALTFMCPSGGGHLSLSELRLESPPVRDIPDRSVWIWRPAAWLEQPAELLSELQALSTPVVYISVPIRGDAVADAESLARFIGAANARGIRVWAVEGDPHAVLPEGRTAFAERARALAMFNADQPPARRLSGVQYDIEPYLLADFALHTSDWLTAYVQTIAVLNSVLEVPVEVAVPFWWSSLVLDDQPLLDALIPHVQSLNVMNYRTDPILLQQFAEPFLSWGARHGIDIRIALEAGPIQDETRWHYDAVDPAGEASRLWHLQLAGESLLVLFEAQTVIPQGSGYRFARRSRFAGSRLTFEGDRLGMDRVMNALETLWLAWPSFTGLALHEYRLQGE